MMAGSWADATSPTLDLDDFIGLPLHHRAGRQAVPAARPAVRQPLLVPQGLVRQRQEYKAAFKEKYGYDLGVPINWSAYEDIAEFFTNDVGEIDGVQIYGHMDYGKRAPDLGWRMTDAWLSMAGAGSKGLPNGIPIDEWGIRMEEGTCNPVGASVSRGGETNGPASVYAIAKWDEWLRKYAPPGAATYDFYQSLPALAGATWRSRSSGTRRSCPTWSSRRPKATTPWTRGQCRCGGWRPRRTAPTGKRA